MEKYLHFRISEEDWKLVKQKADLANITISEYCRRTILNDEIVIKQVSREMKKMEKARLYLLNKAGNNLNQIARFLNAITLHKIPIDEKIIKKVMRDFDEIKFIFRISAK